MSTSKTFKIILRYGHTSISTSVKIINIKFPCSSVAIHRVGQFQIDQVWHGKYLSGAFCMVLISISPVLSMALLVLSTVKRPYPPLSVLIIFVQVALSTRVRFLEKYTFNVWPVTGPGNGSWSYPMPDFSFCPSQICS